MNSVSIKYGVDSLGIFTEQAVMDGFQLSQRSFCFKVCIGILKTCLVVSFVGHLENHPFSLY